MEAKSRGTLLGILAILMWSTTAVFVVAADSINPFFFSSISYICGMLVFASHWLFSKSFNFKRLISTPLWYIVAGIFGIVIHDLTWIAAAQNAPPIEALLFIYQWPLLVVIFTSISTGKKIPARYYLSIFLGLAGLLTILIGRGLEFSSFTLLSGHIYGIISALTWSIFVAISARHKNVHTDSLFIVMLAGAIINIIITAIFIDIQSAETSHIVIATIGGLFFFMPAYLLWDVAVKNGDPQLLGIASFLLPVLSALSLVITGFSQFTIYSVVALVLIMTGIAIAKSGGKITKKEKQLDNPDAIL